MTETKNQKIILTISAILIILMSVIAIKNIYFFKYSEENQDQDSDGKFLIENKFEEFDISKFNSAEDFILYVNENFEITEREEEIVYSPQELFEKKKGGKNDIAFFISKFLNEGNSFSAILRYFYFKENQKKIETVIIYRDYNKYNPDYLYFENDVIIMKEVEEVYESIFLTEEGRLGIEIKGFQVFFPNNLDLTPKKEWKSR